MTASHAMPLLIATSNLGKIKEFTDLASLGFALEGLREANLESPEETGSTFQENAILKARFVANATGMLTIADDSGLVVQSLDDAPGVRSARYAGETATDAQNRARLASVLRDKGMMSASAYFVCVLAIVQSDGTLNVVEGKCDGTIITEGRGENGFGYDSMFQLDDGRTMAELTYSEKHAISHRGAALLAAAPILRRIRATSTVVGNEATP